MKNRDIKKMKLLPVTIFLLGSMLFSGCSSNASASKTDETTDNVEANTEAVEQTAAENDTDAKDSDVTVDESDAKTDETTAEAANEGTTEAQETDASENTDGVFENNTDTTAANAEGLSDVSLGEFVDEAGSSEKAEISEADKAEMTETLIKKVADEAKVTQQDVRHYLVDDFDGDGKIEGFMFVGEEPVDEWSGYSGTIWFVGDSECKQIHDEFEYVTYDDGSIFRTLEGGDKKFAAFSDMYTTAAVTNIFYVDGADCKESAVSRIGSAYIDEETGDLIITISAYDSMCDYEAGSDEPMWTGHTWKPYYFYYNKGAGDFAEYGAKEITREELKSICGSDIAAVLESEGYEIGQIIERDNGIININYSQTTVNADGSKSIDYKNATYDQRYHDFVNAWGDGETGIFSSDFGGTYYIN